MTVTLSVFGLLLVFLSMAGLFARVSMLYSFPLLAAGCLSLGAAMSEGTRWRAVLPGGLGTGLVLYGLTGFAAGLTPWLPALVAVLGGAYLAAAAGERVGRGAWTRSRVP